VRLVCKNKENTDEAVDTIKAAFEGDDMTITINCEYLIQAISRIETENALIELIDDKSIVVVREDDSKEFLCLIAPMRNE